MNTIFVGVEELRHTTNPNRNDYWVTLDHNLSRNLTGEFTTPTLGSVKNLAKLMPNSNIVLFMPTPMDTREIFTDYNYQTVLNEAINIAAKTKNIFILTGNTWDDAYGTVFNNDQVEEDGVDLIIGLFKKHGCSLGKLIYFYVNPLYHKQFTDKTKYLEEIHKPTLMYNPIYLKRFARDIPHDERIEIGKGTKTKRFLMLNRRHNITRLAVAAFLHKNCFHDQINVSYNLTKQDKFDPTHDTITDAELISMYNYYYDLHLHVPKDFLINEFIPKLPLKLDYTGDGGLPIEQQDRFPPNLIYESACYIITETHYDTVRYTSPDLPANRHNFNITEGFYSEKSLKSFLWGLPAIWVANPHTLKSLKYLGFKTYDGMIDETYDTIEDKHDRMNAIFECISKINGMRYDELTGWYQQGISVYSHNFMHLNHFINRDTVSEIDIVCTHKLKFL